MPLPSSTRSLRRPFDARPLLLAAALLVAAAPAWAGRPRTDPPDEFGPFAVGHDRFTLVDESRGGRTLDTEVWYPAEPRAEDPLAAYDLMFGFVLPSTIAFEDAPAGQPAFAPLIVFSHGSGGSSWQSIYLMEALASHGFVVVAPNHTGNTVADQIAGTSVPLLDAAFDRPRDVSFVIDQMLARSADPQDPLHLRIRPWHVGVAGHSFGGYTALASAGGFGLLGIEPDPRVVAIAAIAPAASFFSDDDLAAIDVPLFLLSGTRDTTTPIDPNTIRPWTLVEGPPVYRADIEGATHTAFAEVCRFGALLETLGLSDEAIGGLIPGFVSTCRSAALDVAEVQRITSTYLVAFFRRHLYTHPFYDRWLGEEWAEEHEPLVHYQTKHAPEEVLQ